MQNFTNGIGTGVKYKHNITATNKEHKQIHAANRYLW